MNSPFYLQIPIPCPEQYLFWLPGSHRSHVWTTSPNTAGEGSGSRQTLGSKTRPLGLYNISSECYMFLSEKVSDSRRSPRFCPLHLLLAASFCPDRTMMSFLVHSNDCCVSSATQHCCTSMPIATSFPKLTCSGKEE